MIIFLNDHRLLPEAYLEGLAILREASLHTPSYLRGEYSQAGFRSYFLWTFLLKTPLPAIAAIVAGIALAFYRRMSWARNLAFLLLPVAIGLLSLIPSHINIGHRHLLFVYPFLYVLAGGLANELSKKARTRWPVIAGAIALLALSSSFVFYPLWRPQTIFPHYLAYFNELAGGPLNGWRSLADSNIDWGQDLPGLKHGSIAITFGNLSTCPTSARPIRAFTKSFTNRFQLFLADTLSPLHEEKIRSRPRMFSSTRSGR